MSHLFVDDTLVFCGAEISRLGFLRLVLLFFQVVSGLRINISKSEILPVGDVENIELLASYFGCMVASLHSSHLDMPIGAPFKSKAMWNLVIKRFERRLADGRNNFSQKGDACFSQKHSFELVHLFYAAFRVNCLSSNQIRQVRKRFFVEWTVRDL